MGGKSRKTGGVSNVLIYRLLKGRKDAEREMPAANIIKDRLIKPGPFGEENTMKPSGKKPSGEKG